MGFEHRLMTCEEYLRWSNSEIERKINDIRYASKPESLFKFDEASDEYIFNKNNWNGGDILRYLLYEHACEELNEALDIRWYCINDQKYIFIHSNQGWYIITWYKERGRTEGIYYNGYPITLDEYINLYNELYKIWEKQNDIQRKD